MSTDKSLKHLKSIKTNFSKLFFQTILRNTHGGTAHHKFNSLTVQATGVSRRTVSRVRKELQETCTLSLRQRSKRGQYKHVDDFDDVVIRNNVQEFYTHRHQLRTRNNL